MMRRAIHFTSVLAVTFATCFRTQVWTWTSGHPSASLVMASWISQCGVP